MEKTAQQPELNLDPARFGIYGETDAGYSTISFTRHLDHPIEKVWRAITIPEHRAAWFPQLTLKAELGGDAVVNFSGGDCPPPEDNPEDVYYCKVTAFEPPHLLEYMGPGEHHRYELTEEGSGCVLKFTAAVPAFEEFDDAEQKIQSRFSVSCGWHQMIDQLEWTLDGREFEFEGYAGPQKTKIYIEYLKREKAKSKG